MTERRHKKAVRSARKCENLLDRQRGGNKNGYKWRKSVRCRLCRGSSEGREVLRNSGNKGFFKIQKPVKTCGNWYIIHGQYTGSTQT